MSAEQLKSFIQKELQQVKRSFNNKNVVLVLLLSEDLDFQLRSFTRAVQFDNTPGVGLTGVSVPLCLQVMKTYHMYHTESISAESKLKDAEKQEEKQFSKSGDLNVNLLRHEDRQPRRTVRKIEKMKEKVSDRLLFRL